MLDARVDVELCFHNLSQLAAMTLIRMVHFISALVFLQIAGRVAPNDEPETAAVHIPSRAIGFILGHRGTSIQALTEKTGAQLRVAPAHEITTGASEYRVRDVPNFTGGVHLITHHETDLGPGG